MGSVTFTAIKTKANVLGLAIVEDKQVAGVLLMSLVEERDALVYIDEGVCYVYSTAEGRTSLSPMEQLTMYLNHLKTKRPIAIIAQGVVTLVRESGCIHISVGGVLLASIYTDDTKCQYVVEKTDATGQREFGLDLYDPRLAESIKLIGPVAVKPIILASKNLLNGNMGLTEYPTKLH